MALTKKQRAFVEHYLTCWNATEAARLAGYSERSIRSIASENLTKPDIQEAIQQRLDELKMGADEVLIRLAEQARADLGPYLKLAGGRYEVDIDELKAAGLTHLIKKLSYDKDGNQRLELYDAQAALVQLGRAHGLFTDNVDLTTQGKPVFTADDMARAVDELKEWQRERDTGSGSDAE